MIRIGIVGIGFMGYTHFTAAQRLRGGRVTAIASRNPKKRKGNWKGIQGNFGPPAGQVDLTGVTAFETTEELLASDEIDLVDVCLPPDLHEEVAVAALKAGKHVFLEKPIATDGMAAGRIVRAAERADRMLMVGQVLPFFPEFRFARETIESGKYGKLLAAHFERVITPPKWSDGMADFKNVGGWGVDLHVHDNHFIRLVCGMPEKVFARGHLREGLVNHSHTNYVFADPDLVVSAVSGGIAAKGLEFAHGFEIYLERATLLYRAGTYAKEWVIDRPLTVIDDRGTAKRPKLKGGSEWYSAFTAELQAACNTVKTGQPDPILSGNLARDALRLCDAERKSIATGRLVKV